MIQAFIFDMDGVLIDSEPLHFAGDIDTMKHLGEEITQEELERFVGTTNPEMWAIIRAERGLSQTVEEIIAYQLAGKIKALEESAYEPIDGIPELLEELKRRGIPVGLASSSAREFILAVLAKFGIASYFSCVVSGEEVARGKPAPDVYLEAARQLGADPRGCVVLEDSRNGILAAKAAGMTCIGYVNENSGNQDLSAADRVVRSIREIAAIAL
ncbi:HAD family hydrolase [Cohnella cellulosilytica]|uniref:HAD family hydrolase n=2 Tax=Cohnella cellulosilytica TaxID=986710 RepID=A0ABW2FKE1_9BACL